MAYTDGETRTNAEGAVGMSNLAILLVTKNYIEDLLDANSKVAKEIRLLKQYQTPAILIFFKDGAKLDAERLLTGLNVVEILYDAPYDEGFGKWLKANLDPVIEKHRSGLGQPT